MPAWEITLVALVAVEGFSAVAAFLATAVRVSVPRIKPQGGPSPWAVSWLTLNSPKADTATNLVQCMSNQIEVRAPEGADGCKCKL